MAKDVLAALEDFLSSVAAVKLSKELFTDPSAPDAQGAPGTTVTKRDMEEEIRLMSNKARQLDKRLKKLGISFKDAERGGDSTCEKLVDAVSTELLDTQGPGTRQELAEENKLLEACSSKNNELFKNIQDVQKQMSEIGLKDPTVPAVKHR